MAEKRGLPKDAGDASGTKRPRSNDPTSTTSKPSIQEQIEAAKARAAAIRASHASNSVHVPSSAAPSPAEAARARIEAMKARVAAATSRSATAAPVRTHSSMQEYQSPPPPPPPLEAEEPVSRARGGLGIGLHPALLGDSSNDARTRVQAMPPKFATTMANRRQASSLPPPAVIGAKAQKQLDLSGPSLEEIKANPYFDKNINNAAGLQSRKSRELVFNEQGKYMAQAAAMRRQAHLEDMKRRIAESAKRAGLDEDRSEQAFLVTAPPDVEWWDEGLITGSTYPDFEMDTTAALKSLKIDTSDTIITRYVQHPVLLTPPQDKLLPAPKPMYMIREEQRKKRRQDRSEVLKEKQAKVRLGLEPPEAPKIKKSNLMRVLGEQAVKDPTAVEARVNREIAERKEKHEETNEARKLTKEERLEKLAANQEKDAGKGVMVSVYRIDSLAFGKHRYRVDINAKQNGLTGITILNPKFCLIIVEGGAKSISNYRKVIMQRTDWTENGFFEGERKARPAGAGPDPMEVAWLKPEDEQGELRDQSTNRCVLLWEGEEKARAFKKWGSRVCETEGEAQDVLKRAKMENMWMLAKNQPNAV